MKKEAEEVQKPTAQGTPGTKQDASSEKSGKNKSKSTSIRKGEDLINVIYEPIDRFVNVAKIETGDTIKYAVALGNMGIMQKDEWVDNYEEAVKIAKTAIVVYRVMNVIQLANEAKKTNSKAKN